ncbi:hypothetical protein [Natrarchaeobaculum aegyptiacum]|uniref:Uncharacterized protein n=1 Tax=Natrarchaeobaculum aegyptiacum TaxID=745377 RepID=A0A2Z2I2E5_9EURY|nr:hypothetical protein [Natrarchaeobaculum aegyptiacum]ARS90968.1 hypothetical protein B1756_15340 [Natrarchaeobaculum aegyptiacum]
MTNDRDWVGLLLLAAAVLATGIVYLWLVPRSVSAGEDTLAIRYLVVGWIPYVLAWYLLGRRYTSPEALPNMRTADAGLALVLVSLLLSLGLDAWGFTPEQVPGAHALQAIAIFVGLALLGWGLGRRSSALAAG